MKILVVSNMFPNKEHPNYGIFVKHFCENLEDIGVEYDLIKLCKEANIVKKSIKYCCFFLKTFLKTLLGKYDYVYVHYVAISGMGVLAAKHFRKINMIANAHGTDIIPESMRQKKNIKHSKTCLKKADKIVVPSEYFKNYVVKKYSDSVAEDRIYIYPSGGISREVFYRMPPKEISELYVKYGLNREKKYYGYCGRINANKGIATLIKAFSIIYNQNTDIGLIIVGSGPYEPEMERLLKEEGLEETVKCYGMMTQPELNEIYNILHCFVFPTRGESLGLVAIEAMACGVPVIASDVAAPASYMRDGINGFKFEVENSELLAEKMRLINEMNIEQYEKLKTGAFNTGKGYWREHVANMLRQILED